MKNDAVNIKFVEPPPAHRSTPTDTERIVGSLKRNPGRWALVSENRTSTSSFRWNARGCEVTTRSRLNTSGVRVYDTYVRWPKSKKAE